MFFTRPRTVFTNVRTGTPGRRLLALAIAAACAACGTAGTRTAKSPEQTRAELTAAEMQLYAQADSAGDAVPDFAVSDSTVTNPPAANPGGGAPPDATARIEPQEMRVSSHIQGRDAIVDIFSPPPVGGAQLSAPQGGWPASLRLRFHQMTAMQGFTARTRIASLRCDAAIADAMDAPHLCMFGDKPVDAITRKTDGFEVVLPAGMLSAEDSSIEVRWVDRYR